MRSLRRMRRGVGLVAALAGTAVAVAAFAGGMLVGETRAPRSSPGVLEQAQAAIEARTDAATTPARLDAAAISAMLGSLGDPWASYYTPGGGPGGASGFAALLHGRYSGIGVWLQAGPGGRGVQVQGVLPHSPAAGAGIAGGDVITAVDGRPVGSADQTQVVDELQGASGTLVQLALTRGTRSWTVSLRRAATRLGNVEAQTVAPGIVRISVAQFSAGVAGQVAAILQAARRHGLRGIVLDLRGDPGGLLAEGLALAGQFLNGGPVVTLSGRTVPSEVLDAPTGGDPTTPLAVLVDGGTASAAEIVAGALQDRGRAVLIGSRTFGKATVQEPVTLSNGSMLEVTVAHYRTPNGRDLGGVGLTPDITVPVGADPGLALGRAVAVLQGLAAGPPLQPAAATQPVPGTP